MRAAQLVVPVLLASALLAPGAVRAQTLSADLSSHLVAITTGFTGTSVVLFGATDGTGDVVATVRGPERDMVVRRKSQVLGIWINTRQVGFSAVPSYYALYTSRPLEEIAPPAMQAMHQIGLDNLRITPAATSRAIADLGEFRSALFAEQERQRLYAREPGHIVFLGDRLFRATIDFPADVPTGDYLVEVFLVRDKVIVSGQTTPLVVAEIGVDAEVNDFAQRQAWLYGIIAVAIAAAAGWVASLPFRNA